MTRIPHDERYTACLGKAVYVFSYYEWTLIYIIERLKPGFVHEFARGERYFTSGTLKRRLDEVLSGQAPNLEEDLIAELRTCHDEFHALVPKRNALVHAHPITDAGGDQILLYQANTEREISDFKWELQRIEEFIGDVDQASSFASRILQRLTLRAEGVADQQATRSESKA